jgi:hypothetical protein
MYHQSKEVIKQKIKWEWELLEMGEDDSELHHYCVSGKSLGDTLNNVS